MASWTEAPVGGYIPLEIVSVKETKMRSTRTKLQSIMITTQSLERNKQAWVKQMEYNRLDRAREMQSRIMWWQEWLKHLLGLTDSAEFQRREKWIEEGK